MESDAGLVRGAFEADLVEPLARVVEPIGRDIALAFPSHSAADRFFDVGARPGAATSSRLLSAQARPVGSTRATAVTSSRLAATIGSAPAGRRRRRRKVDRSAFPGRRSYRALRRLARGPARESLGAPVSMTSRPRPGSQPETGARGPVPLGVFRRAFAFEHQARGVGPEGEDLGIAVERLGDDIRVGAAAGSRGVRPQASGYAEMPRRTIASQSSARKVKAAKRSSAPSKGFAQLAKV